MRFDPPLLPGRFLRRYKRFFADVRLETGEVVVAHCPNTGAMTGYLTPNHPVMLARSDNPRRKLGFTWVMSRVRGRWVGLVPTWAPRLLAEYLERGREPALAGYERLVTEVAWRDSRLDLLLSSGGRLAPGQRPGPRARFVDDERTYVEVKSVTLMVASGVVAFPDAPTERGRRHLRVLSEIVEAGHRGVMVYVVQHSGCRAVRPADEIDPEYGTALRRAVDSGVEVLAFSARVGPRSIGLSRRLEVVL